MLQICRNALVPWLALLVFGCTANVKVDATGQGTPPANPVTVPIPAQVAKDPNASQSTPPEAETAPDATLPPMSAGSSGPTGPSGPAALPGTSVADTIAPVVNAGPDRIENAAFSISATAEDASALSFAWTVVSGPGAVTFATPQAKETSVAATADGSYLLRLTATDAAGNVAADELVLVWDTTAPVLDGGLDPTVKAATTVTAVATDLSTVSYAWTQVSGPGSVTFGTSAAAVTTVAASADGVYVLRITATDAVGHATVDDVVLTWDTVPPTVDAGIDHVVQALVSQNATASDASPLTFAWTRVSGPDAITFGTPAAEDSTIAAAADGTYVLRLTVTDAAGNAAADDTTLTWDTSAPVVNAGSDEETATATTITATATDASAMTYLWEKASGPGTVTFGSAAAESTTVAANAFGTYVLRFTATDAFGRSAADTMSFVWQDPDAGLFDWAGIKQAGPTAGIWFNRNGGSGAESNRDGGLSKQDWVAASEHFVMQGSNNRISKFDAVTGEFLGWIGLIAASPTDGATGCRGAAVDTMTPGWCRGGLAKSGSESGAGGYKALDIDEANDRLFAVSNKSILKFKLSTGEFLGWTGYVKFRTASDDGACSVTTYKTADDCTGNGGTWTPTAVPATVSNALTFARDDDVGHTKGSALCDVKKPGEFTGGWCFGGVADTASKNWAPGLNDVVGMVGDSEYLYFADRSGNSRVQKFRKSTGRFIGWIGRISATADPDALDLDVNALAKTSDAAHAAIADCSKKCSVGTTITVRTEAQCTTAGGTWTIDRAAGDFTTAWCEGGTPTGNSANDGSISSPRGLGLRDGYLFISEKAHRVSRFDAATGEYLGWVGKITAAPVANAPGNNGKHCANYCRLADHASLGACVAATGNWRVPANVCEHPTINTNDASECTGTALGSALSWAARTNMATNGWCLGGTVGSDSTAEGDGMLNSNESLVAGPGFVYVGDDNDRIQRFELVSGAYRGWTGSIDATSRPRPGVDGHADCASTALADGDATPGWCYGGKARRLDDSNHPTKGVFCSPEDQMGYANGRIFVSDGDCTRKGGRIHVWTVADASTDGANGSYYGWLGVRGASTTAWEPNTTIPHRGIGAGIGVKFNDANGGVAIKGSYVYVVDDEHHRIVRMTASGVYAGWLGRIATAPTDTDDPCFGMAADAFSGAWCLGGTSKSGNGDGAMNKPTDLVTDAAGELYVVDSNNNRVLRFAASGTFLGWKGKIATLPSCATASVGQTTPDWCLGGTAASGNGNGHFSTPIGIAISGGSLFIADTGNHRVQKIALDDAAYEATYGTGLGTGDAQLNGPRAVTWWQDPVSTTEYVYIADRGNHRVVRYPVATPGSPDGWIGFDSVAALAKTGFANGGTGAIGTGDGAFDSPQGRGFVDDDGALSLSDTGNNRIVKINARTGAFLGWRGRVKTPPTSGDAGCTTLVSGLFTGGWCKGGTAQAGYTSGFESPRSLVVAGDATNGFFLYLADASNHRIVRLSEAD